MKYLVMECHPGYAVVLDEKGEFIKVANMHYEVGQTVYDVIKMKMPTAKGYSRKKGVKQIYSLCALAASLVLIFTSVFTFTQTTYASIYMKINPEIRVDVSRKDIVLKIEAINDDGKRLLENYDYKDKHLDLAMEELLDKAIQMKFLSEGKKIILTFDTNDENWIVSHSESISAGIHKHIDEVTGINIEITNDIPKSDNDYDDESDDFDSIEENIDSDNDIEENDSDEDFSDDEENDSDENFSDDEENDDNDIDEDNYTHNTEHNDENEDSDNEDKDEEDKEEDDDSGVDDDSDDTNDDSDADDDN